MENNTSNNDSNTDSTINAAPSSLGRFIPEVVNEPPDIVNFGSKITSFLVEAAKTFLSENLTSVMSNLEESDNQDLYSLINFLYVYKNSENYNFAPEEYQELDRLYKSYLHIQISSIDYNITANFNNVNNGKITQQINITNVLNKTDKIAKHVNTINIFNQLSETEQTEITNLAKFLVYCNNNGSQQEFLEQYQELIKSIRDYTKE